jgi:hypothetical protein
MDAWRIEVDLGLLELARHRPRVALGHLEHALRGCPERRSADLARIFFYLGITLTKLGLAGPAIRSWMSSQRLAKRGLGRRMLNRYANEYGMVRRSCPGQDDWHAFYSVHVGRYLRSRPGHAFQSPVERALVGELIEARWDRLRHKHDLRNMSTAEKCAVFRGVSIDLPAFVVAHEQATIAVNFPEKRRVSGGERCGCGSGRPYASCCGRIAGLDEVICGP